MVVAEQKRILMVYLFQHLTQEAKLKRKEFEETMLNSQSSSNPWPLDYETVLLNTASTSTFSGPRQKTKEIKTA